MGSEWGGASADPAGLDEAEYVELLHADGTDLEELAAPAADVRRREAGDALTLHRNLDSSLPLPRPRGSGAPENGQRTL